MRALTARFGTALIAVGLAACIEADLVPCGDQLCPGGLTCVDSELCATNDQISACAGAIAGGTCSVGGGVGRCDRGVCIATGCGNQVVDFDEVCDDGNVESGDGCRADCSKREVCGDAVVDDGEGCDDGNANAADGCDACAPTTWRATAVTGGNATATAVGLAFPPGVAVDRLGNLYIADADNHRVRRVDAAGVITTIAGTGAPGFAGDGGAATSARLSTPSGVAVDGLGMVYIADRNNHRVRRVDATGVITTIAGTGTAGAAGDDGAGTIAQLGFPMGVAVDGLGRLYIADSNNHRIRRVDALGIITTVAGNGTFGDTGDGGLATSAQLRFPRGVAVNGLGTLYIADSSNHRVRRVDAAGVITTVAGGAFGFGGDGNAATSAQLANPTAIALDDVGNFYIADETNHRVRRVDAAGIITTIAGSGTQGGTGDGGAATSARLAAPYGVAVDGLGTLYIADQNNHRVRRVDAAGVISTVAGTGSLGFTGDGGSATSAPLATPAHLAVDSLGAFYIADQVHHRVRRVDPSGVITTVAGIGTPGAAGDTGAATSAQLNRPQGVAVDGLGRVFVADTTNHRVRRIDEAGIITTVAGTGGVGSTGDGDPATSARLNAPTGIAVSSLGVLYIADRNNHRVRRVDAAGVITTVAGTGTLGAAGDGGPATGAELARPFDVALDDLGRLYIADQNNHRVRRVDVAGVITTVAGIGTAGAGGDGGAATSAELSSPVSVAVDGLGTLYISDGNNHRVRRVDPAGIITTIAGTGTFEFAGDGGDATKAQLNTPFGVAVDALGRVYVADSNNQRVRRIDASGVITTIAGTVAPEGMGPLAQARLADPRAIVVAGPLMLVAGGSSGTVQASRGPAQSLEVVTGRYPHAVATGARARFRDLDFGEVSGIAYDAGAKLLFLTESSSHRLHVVTVVDPEDPKTWTIAPLANSAGIAGFADGSAGTARFRNPRGLYFDPSARELFVADTGNHAIRAIDLAAGVTAATVRTVAGIPATRGYFGDAGLATAALLHAPEAITRCANGDLFIADTGNHRVRRLAASSNVISTVLGVGVGASSGEGHPASTFPVHAPLGLACDPAGNLFVSSTTTVRLLPATADGSVDGTGEVRTIYGVPPRMVFPASVTTCLTGLAVIDATTVHVVDSCSGLLVELRRGPL